MGVHTRHANSELTRPATGKPEATRANGVRHLQISNDVLRDNAQWPDT